MNDLDLPAVLHRDADLVGEPATDLLDRLSDRRRLQRRRRAAVIGTTLAVTLVAVGAPTVGSLVAGSDAAPPVGVAVDPTPSVNPEDPTTAPVPAPPVAPETAVVETVPVPEADPVCDFAAMAAALPADTAERRFRLVTGAGELCSGTWAAASYSEIFVDASGEEWPDGQAGLFHYVDGSWTWLDRYTTDVCDDPAVPAAVWERGCNVD